MFASALVLAAACEKMPSSTDFDGEFLVYTAHSEEAGDFARFETFTVADSLLAIDGNRGSSREDSTNGAFAPSFRT